MLYIVRRRDIDSSLLCCSMLARSRVLLIVEFSPRLPMRTIEESGRLHLVGVSSSDPHDSRRNVRMYRRCQRDELHPPR